MARETSEERRDQPSPPRDRHDWESNMRHHDDTSVNQRMWESEDFQLNPNRISTKSDDILLHGRDESHRNLGLSNDVGYSKDQLSISSPQKLSSAMSPKISLQMGSPDLSRQLSGDRAQQMASGEYQRPPLHKSSSDVVRDSNQKEDAPMPEKRFPPPPSELGTLMKTILEGWLEKKSSKLGIWQKVILISYTTLILFFVEIFCTFFW